MCAKPTHTFWTPEYDKRSSLRELKKKKNFVTGRTETPRGVLNYDLNLLGKSSKSLQTT